MSTIHLRYFKIRDAHPAGPAGFQNVVESNNWARNYLGVSRLTNISVTNSEGVIQTSIFQALDVK